MPVTGVLTGRLGCRKVIVAAGLMMCVSLICLITAPSILTMALALLVFGASVGTVDVAMNIQAVMVEKASGRAMMSGFHGDRKSTRLNSSHVKISYAVFCLKKKNRKMTVSIKP